MDLLRSPRPKFFLAEPPRGGLVRLAQGEEEHARRVLRLEAGSEAIGLDGRGGVHPLVVAAVRLGGRRGRGTQGSLEFRVVGASGSVPAPGETGSALPWIEVAVAWPRRSRAEEMIGRLVQLGAAALTPMEAEHRGPEEIPREAPERWWKIARDACKQCERAWLPVFRPRVAALDLPSARPGALLALLEPDRGMSLDTWLRSLLADAARGAFTAARPIVLAIGPEGGFSARESAAFHEAGATSVKLAPHVLRVETAAEAAAAVAALVLMSS